ncbi:hypothetical protein IDJ81_07110 [Tsuneonella flava]|uniref:Uncharacterized protein n=1 Tax=Tsuneonella flava TaxID=2055955 RepID=A0ABX7KCZ7_9SPHN|nr:hypothetical protein [Tsuneonella flava]QSB45842.1 hypothetical protein IDJ81_07110 [Tsuneonella flava]
MNFASRLKKEMSEGIVRAVLEHACCRVTDFGIEKAVPYFNLHAAIRAISGILDEPAASLEGEAA